MGDEDLLAAGLFLERRPRQNRVAQSARPRISLAAALALILILPQSPGLWPKAVELCADTINGIGCGHVANSQGRHSMEQTRQVIKVVQAKPCRWKAIIAYGGKTKPAKQMLAVNALCLWASVCRGDTDRTGLGIVPQTASGLDSLGFALVLVFLVIAAVAVAWAIRLYGTGRDLRRDCESLKRELEGKETLLAQTNARLSHRSSDLAQAYSFLSAEIAERQQAELELDRVQNQNHKSHPPAAVNEPAIDALKRAAV